MIHKLGVVRTLLNRADDIVTEEEDRVKEKEHIRKALHRCDYPDWAIDRVAKPKPRQEKEHSSREPSGPKMPPIGIPYIRGVSEEMRRIYKHYNINVFYKPYNTLKQILVRPKDKTPKETSVE